jgi:hypothetical protein
MPVAELARLSGGAGLLEDQESMGPVRRLLCQPNRRALTVAGSPSQRPRLPPRHLEPVLQALVHQGILTGTRGPRGGYELAREQHRITADDILRFGRY